MRPHPERHGKGGIGSLPNESTAVSAFFRRCKRIKGLPYLLLALAAGLILLLLPAGKSDEPVASSTPDSTEYRLALEQEVRRLLLDLEGVEDCTVVLTLSYGYEYTYATDQRVKEQADSNYKETEKTIVLATENGNQTPLTLREKQPIVCGVAVVCPGADEAIRGRISSLLRALFALEDPFISIQS